MTTTLENTDRTTRTPAPAPTRFLWLELTGRCQLACRHCYADSSPLGTHGTMVTADWLRVLDDAPRAGVLEVQFIGGEPTTHPDFYGLAERALCNGLNVEVYSNLYRISAELWELFERPGVRLATSYYSDDAAQHDAVTLRPGSHGHTRAAIVEALRRRIPLRVGIIDLGDDQRVEEARAELRALGVEDIGVDRMRGVGRGAGTTTPDASQLCGHCANGVAAISPDGMVWPCVFSRWMPLGNVREEALGDILTGRSMEAARTTLASEFQANGQRGPKHCDPENSCGPNDQDCRPWCVPVTK